MKERPILFSGPMVRAMLAGTKTQTRRVVKPQPQMVTDKRTQLWEGPPTSLLRLLERSGRSCPYGHPGNRLWVKEGWMPDPPCDGTWGYTEWAGCRIGQIAGVPDKFRKPDFCIHRATWPHKDDLRWKPAIHMPRWASRITLEVTGVRVERLQEISESDAMAEGVTTGKYAGLDRAAARSYSELWESINGPGSWDENPWVWVVEFKNTATTPIQPCANG